MANVADIYNLWLKPWHLPVDKPATVTVQKAEVMVLHPRPTEERPAIVLTFAGKQRRLILNDGNANKMSDIGGEDYTAWTGLVIQIQRKAYNKNTETIIIKPAPTTNGTK